MKSIAAAGSWFKVFELCEDYRMGASAASNLLKTAYQNKLQAKAIRGKGEESAIKIAINYNYECVWLSEKVKGCSKIL